MTTRKLISTLLVAVFATSVGAATAAPVVVSSYDMPNGYTGSYQYWDDTYSGSGSTTTNGAPLSGGKGDLTDGVIAASNWNITEAPAGAGPYVGWLNINPVIHFHFGGPVTINTISFSVDDANGFGSVSTPLSVVIGGVTYGLTDPAGSAPFQFDVSGLSLNVSDLDITINRRNAWVFVSEISFDGSDDGSVPEPGSLALLGLGLAGLAWRKRTSR